MADTIFYKLELKKKKTPEDVFLRMQKFIKKRGPTKKWICSVDDNKMSVDFGDDISETFVLQFVGKQAEGFCKVEFSMDCDLFRDESSEYRAFLVMLHSAKKYCENMEISDDYDVAQEVFNDLDYQLKFRELNQNEKERLDRLYQLGFHNYEEFLLAIISEDLGMPEIFKWEDYLNKNSENLKLYSGFPPISVIFEYYLYETSMIKKHRLPETDRYRYFGGDPPAEVYAFALGVGALFKCYDFLINTWGRGIQVTNYYIDKFLPVFKKAGDYEKCELAYRFMMSVYDFCKFTFAGKEGTEPACISSYSDKSGYAVKNIPMYL